MFANPPGAPPAIPFCVEGFGISVIKSCYQTKSKQATLKKMMTARANKDSSTVSLAVLDVLGNTAMFGNAPLDCDAVCATLKQFKLTRTGVDGACLAAFRVLMLHHIGTRFDSRKRLARSLDTSYDEFTAGQSIGQSAAAHVKKIVTSTKCCEVQCTMEWSSKRLVSVLPNMTEVGVSRKHIDPAHSDFDATVVASALANVTTKSASHDALSRIAAHGLQAALYDAVTSADALGCVPSFVRGDHVALAGSEGVLLCTIIAACALFYETLKASLITTRPCNGVDVTVQAAHVALTTVYNAFPVCDCFSTSICREVAGLLEAGDVGFLDTHHVVQGVMTDEDTDRITDLKPKSSATTPCLQTLKHGAAKLPGSAASALVADSVNVHTDILSQHITKCTGFTEKGSDGTGCYATAKASSGIVRAINENAKFDMPNKRVHNGGVHATAVDITDVLAVLYIGCTQALAKVVDDHSNTYLSSCVRVIENQSVMDAARLQSTRAQPACHVFRLGAAAFNALGTPAVLWKLPCGMLNVDAAPHQCYEQHKISTSALLQMQHAMDPCLKPTRLHPHHKLLRKMPKMSCPAFKVYHSACCGCKQLQAAHPPDETAETGRPVPEAHGCLAFRENNQFWRRGCRPPQRRCGLHCRCVGRAIRRRTKSKGRPRRRHTLRPFRRRVRVPFCAEGPCI